MSAKIHSRRKFSQWLCACLTGQTSYMAKEYIRNFPSIFLFSISFLIFCYELWGVFSLGWSKNSVSHSVFTLVILIFMSYCFILLSQMELPSCFLTCRTGASFLWVTAFQKKTSQFLRIWGSALLWIMRVYTVWDFSPTILKCSNFIWILMLSEFCCQRLYGIPLRRRISGCTAVY